MKYNIEMCKSSKPFGVEEGHLLKCPETVVSV